MKMTKTHDCPSVPVLATALVAVLCLQSAAALAQSAPDSSRKMTTQSESKQAFDENAAPVFIGKVLKSGDKFVLSTADATYQLDDQQQVRAFLNQNVKVTGVLDAASGTIRVGVIGPA